MNFRLLQLTSGCLQVLSYHSITTVCVCGVRGSRQAFRPRHGYHRARDRLPGPRFQLDKIAGIWAVAPSGRWTE